MNPTKLTLRKVRVLHAVFLLTMFLYICMLSIVRPVGQGVQFTFVLALGFLALSDLGIALFFRKQKVEASVETLRTHPDDPAALNQWCVGMILSFCFAETIALFGFVLKILGADWKIAGAFFAFAVLLMLLWTPRLDLPGAR